MKLNSKGVEAAAVELRYHEILGTDDTAAAIKTLEAFFEATNTVPVPREPTIEIATAMLGWREFDLPDHWPHGLHPAYGSYRAMIAAQEMEG